MEEDLLFKERAKQVADFVKKNIRLISAVFLAVIVYIAVFIRTRPMIINPSSGKPGLWDIARDNWTLGPDLDPFLFLRWAKDIVATGSLMAVDTLRNVPLGYPTKGELILLPNLMAWFHKVVTIFQPSASVEYSAVIFPVFMFALTVVAFFFMTRKMFIDQLGELKASIIALLASLFLTVLPSLLSRTIAGIPEKESAAFLFLFLSFYFYLCSWKSTKSASMYVFAALAGASTAAMALIWGGYQYIVLTITITIFLAFFLGAMNKSRILSYFVWVASFVLLAMPFSSRYTLINLATSTSTFGAVVFLPALLIVSLLLQNTKFGKNLCQSNSLKSIPLPWLALGVLVLMGLLLLALTPQRSIEFVSHNVQAILKNLITPIVDRFGVTVAENKQPYFAEWAGSFGPSLADFLKWSTFNAAPLPESLLSLLGNIPIVFWMFFAGSVIILYFMARPLDSRERVMITIAYVVFLFCLVFSRYSDSSILNGTNFQSKALYFIGFASLAATLVYIHWKYHASGQNDRFLRLDFGYLLLFAFFFLSVVSARGAVRTIMVLVPSAAIFASAFVVVGVNALTRIERKDFTRIFGIIALVLLLLLTIFALKAYYDTSVAAAMQQIPSIYTQQWQLAMDWVRNNTPRDAVFGHWWDYGYWLQSIGERATVLDGGNAIVYWNHMMGRYALTGRDDKQAIDFLYAHNTTHFLIDSTDIGKYGAFSSIGSGVEYDRRSWIPALVRDDTQAIETKNGTVYVYVAGGGIPLDQDIVYTLNGTKTFLPEGSAALVGVTMPLDSRGSLQGQPQGVYIYRNNQYMLPLKYVYINGELKTFREGIEGGAFVFSRLTADQVIKNGALLYLSNKTVQSQVARLYLYNQNNSYFKLVHSEDDFLVSQLKSQLGYTEDFVYYGDLRGPIRIWEIDYPEGMTVDPRYLETTYPDERLTRA